MAKNQSTQTTQQTGTTNATQNATSSASRDPWAPATPYLTGLLGQAAGQYDASSNPAATAALGTGQNAAIQNATAGNTTALAQQGMGTVSGLLGGDGLSDAQRSALGGIGSALGSFNGALGSTAGMLTPLADGSQVGANNPQFQQSLQASLNSARDTIGSQFSGAGRYGSAAMGSAEGTALGNVAANATQQQYNQDRATQLAAIGQLGGLASSGLSGNLSGQGQIAGIGQQGIASKLAGIGSIGGLGADQNVDAQTLMGVGQQGWQNLDNYASLVSSLGQQGGTTSGTQSGTSTGLTSSSGKSTTQNSQSLLGSLLSGAGLVGNLFTAPMGGTSAVGGIANFFK